MDFYKLYEIKDWMCAKVKATSVQKTPENQFYPPMFPSIEPSLSSTSLMSEILSDSLGEQDEEDEQRNGFDGDNEFTFKDKELFTRQFKAMTNDRKWKLSTGKYVEDILYDLGMKCKYHNLVHSFIINPKDNFVQTGFNSKEISEITNKEYGNYTPDIDENLLAYINNFAKESTNEIREVLNAQHPKLGKDFNIATDFQYEHVRTTIADWVRLYEMTPNPLCMEMPESWYRIHVWRTIDIAFSDLPYVFLIGGEKACLATSERKNRLRTLDNFERMQRKAIGRKGDGYVRTLGSRQLDWAASEAGRKWRGESGTKLLKEGLTLPKTLKDIFIELSRRVNYCEDKVRKINVPGFIHSGAVMIKTNLDCPGGYVCRYMIEKPYEVYADIKNFPRTLDVLISVIYAKLEIIETMKIINNQKSDDNMQRWKNKKKPRRMPGYFQDGHLIIRACLINIIIRNELLI
nr:3191_t:CDS:10 [Entrophospora candida]